MRGHNICFNSKNKEIYPYIIYVTPSHLKLLNMLWTCSFSFPGEDHYDNWMKEKQFCTATAVFLHLKCLYDSTIDLLF